MPVDHPASFVRKGLVLAVVGPPRAGESLEAGCEGFGVLIFADSDEIGQTKYNKFRIFRTQAACRKCSVLLLPRQPGKYIGTRRLQGVVEPPSGVEFCAKGVRMPRVVRPISKGNDYLVDALREPGGVDPPMAASLVVAYIRRLIERGDLKAGDKLPPERELARLTGVSRASVRDGIRSLATVGVLEARRGAGTFVSEGSPLFDVNPLSIFSALHGIPQSELFETRRVIEIDLAGLAAERAGGDELAAISEEVMEMFASREDVHRFLVHDIRFHRAVAAAARNPLMAAIMEMVADLFYDQRKSTVDRWRGADEAAEQHRRIYQAIRAGDVESARREMDEHLRWAQNTLALEVKAELNREEAE